MRPMQTVQTLTWIREVHLLWLGPNGGNTEHQQGCKAQQSTGSMNRHHFNTELQEQKPCLSSNTHPGNKTVFVT